MVLEGVPTSEIDPCVQYVLHRVQESRRTGVSFRYCVARVIIESLKLGPNTTCRLCSHELYRNG